MDGQGCQDLKKVREEWAYVCGRYTDENPGLIVTPQELKSKRYVILGKVIDEGCLL